MREGRHLTQTVPSTADVDLADPVRGSSRFSNSVFLGHYFTDVHGCPLPDGHFSDGGLFEVPVGVFISVGVDGFLPELVRGAGVGRAAASSVPMHPEEVTGGEVVGVLVALAVWSGRDPWDVAATGSDAGLPTG